jgi:hypothetical protein
VDGTFVLGCRRRSHGNARPGSLRNQIDSIWNDFWSGGLSNPLQVIEQITYLIFIMRLDDMQQDEELKSTTLGQPLERRIFPKGKDERGEPYENLRWSKFKNFEPREMFRIVDEHVLSVYPRAQRHGQRLCATHARRTVSDSDRATPRQGCGQA